MKTKKFTLKNRPNMTQETFTKLMILKRRLKKTQAFQESA